MATHAEQNKQTATRPEAISGTVVSLDQLLAGLTQLINRADAESMPVLVHLLFAAKNQIVLWSAYGDLYTSIHKRMSQSITLGMPSRQIGAQPIDANAIAIIRGLDQLQANAVVSGFMQVSHIITECRSQITLWVANGTYSTPAYSRLKEQFKRLSARVARAVPKKAKAAPTKEQKALLLHTQHWFPWVMFMTALLQFTVYFACFNG